MNGNDDPSATSPGNGSVNPYYNNLANDQNTEASELESGSSFLTRIEDLVVACLIIVVSILVYFYDKLWILD